MGVDSDTYCLKGYSPTGCGVDVQVEWLPYKDIDHTEIPEDIKNTLTLRASKTMLICFEKAERHLPDRCLRQFGMLQGIPKDVQRWERKSRAYDHGVDILGKMQPELDEWAMRRLHIVEGDDDVDEREYMQWYQRITRKFVGRLTSVESEFKGKVRMHSYFTSHFKQTINLVFLYLLDFFFF